MLPHKQVGWGHRTSWEGTQLKHQTQSDQKDIPYHITSCSAIKEKRGGFRRVSHLLLRNWLGISLPKGGGERLPLHHLFYFLLFFRLINFILFNLDTTTPHAPSCLTFIPPFFFPYLIKGERNGASSCVVLHYPPLSTHNTRAVWSNSEVGPALSISLD